MQVGKIRIGRPRIKQEGQANRWSLNSDRDEKNVQRSEKWMKLTQKSEPDA